MINIVLYEPEIPTNTGNIMRTCAATNAHLHLIEPLGFKLDEKSVKRSGVNYIDKVVYTVYKDFDDFLSKNNGEFYFFTRYGKHPHTDFDFSDTTSFSILPVVCSFSSFVPHPATNIPIHNNATKYFKFFFLIFYPL